MSPESTELLNSKKKKWGRISAQKQLLWWGLITLSALVTFTAWVFIERTQAAINHSVEQFGTALAHALARGGAEALSNTGNIEGLKYYVLTEIQQTPAVAYIVFTDNNGKILLDSQTLPNYVPSGLKIYPIYLEKPRRLPGAFSSPQGFRALMNIAVPLIRNNEAMGICWVGLDDHTFTIIGTPRETKFFMVSIFVLVWFIGALCLGVNYALINRPLKALSDGASHIASGHFGHQVAIQRAGKEIDQVVDAFNYMSNRLQQYDKQNVDSLMAERNKFISEKNKLERVLMSIADGVVVCDRDNKVQIINAAATQLFDKEAKELLGKPLVFCTQGPDSPQICQIIQDFTDTVSPGFTESLIRQIHLGEKTVRLHISPLLLTNEFIGSVMIMQDITRQAELERMKNEFISNVSHELRTPITSIKSYVDTLCNHGEKLEPGTYNEFLRIIDNEADRLMYLVNDVLELSRIEEGDHEFELTPRSILPGIEHVIKSVNLLARDKQIEIALNHAENLPLVDINQESIERCMLNLISNAIKYTPVGGKIDIAVTQQSSELRVDIKDTGIGIPEDCLDQIFDRFYRVERKVHTIKGTGLGLTIVKKIVEEHNGRVTATSALGQGSTFSIFLPVVMSDPLGRPLVTKISEAPVTRT